MFATVTFKPSTQFILEAFEVMDDFLKSFTPPSGSAQWVMAFEPLVAAMIQNMETNILGLGPDNQGYSESSVPLSSLVEMLIR